MSDEHWTSFPSESVNADLPSFAPPPLESFEEELKELEREILAGGFQFPTLQDISTPTYRDASTLYLAPSFESTYSTPGLTEDVSNTEYSSMGVSTSNYPSLFDPAFRDIVFSSEDNYYVDTAHNPVISDSSTFSEESGTPQLFFQHDHVVNSQLDDDGRDRQLVGNSPHCLSAASQSPPPGVPNDPPADAVSTARVFTGPIGKKPTCNQCDQCGRVVLRKNLKEHMKTHDPNRERPFECPESDCKSRFYRSNDLKRHLENINIHGVRAG
ncbi:hypothetical protein V8E53_007553 [Lactarius tabidus]